MNLRVNVSQLFRRKQAVVEKSKYLGATRRSWDQDHMWLVELPMCCLYSVYHTTASWSIILLDILTTWLIISKIFSMAYFQSHCQDIWSVGRAPSLEPQADFLRQRAMERVDAFVWFMTNMSVVVSKLFPEAQNRAWPVKSKKWHLHSVSTTFTTQLLLQTISE